MKQKTYDVVMQGVAAGFFGFLTVGAVFAIANVLVGRSPVYTAAVLGANMFYGIADPSQMGTSLAPYVFAYNGVHLMAFLVLGMAGSWLAAVAEKGAMLWYPALFFFIFVAFHMIGGVQLLAEPVRAAVPMVSVWLAGALATMVMGAYLLRVHPHLVDLLRGWQE